MKKKLMLSALVLSLICNAILITLLLEVKSSSSSTINSYGSFVVTSTLESFNEFSSKFKEEVESLDEMGDNSLEIHNNEINHYITHYYGGVYDDLANKLIELNSQSNSILVDYSGTHLNDEQIKILNEISSIYNELSIKFEEVLSSANNRPSNVLKTEKSSLIKSIDEAVNEINKLLDNDLNE